MADADERMKTLKMIEEGKIGPEDGAKLLSALSEGRRSGAGYGNWSTVAGRWLRIRVTDIVTGRSKAVVQIPLGLVDAGLKIGAHFAPEVEGVDMSSVIDALHSGKTGRIIDVTDDKDGEHIEIYVE
jgi:hypothetical protein